MLADRLQVSKCAIAVSFGKDLHALSAGKALEPVEDKTISKCFYVGETACFQTCFVAGQRQPGGFELLFLLARYHQRHELDAG